MLTTKKSTTLNGTSVIGNESGNEVHVVSMSASISEEGPSNIVTNIINKTVYEANKAACRADIDAFTAYVREVEDAE